MKRRLCSATLNLLFGEVAVAVTVVVCFYKEEDILNISEMNRKIFKCKHSCDCLLLTIQMSENSPWEP